MNSKISSIVAAAVLAPAAMTFGDSVIIDGLGGPLVLESAGMNVLNGEAGELLAEDLDVLHAAIQADGVVTDRAVTFVLLNTGAGLSFMSLIDDSLRGGKDPATTLLDMASTGPSSLDYYINDAADLDGVFDPFGVTQTVSASFSWRQNYASDGFAWANLQEGDSATFNWTLVSGTGLATSTPFRFVTWNGESWEMIATGDFSADDQFAFSFTVVPLPAALLMGAAGLGGLAAMRRRRSAR